MSRVHIKDLEHSQNASQVLQTDASGVPKWGNAPSVAIGLQTVLNVDNTAGLQDITGVGLMSSSTLNVSSLQSFADNAAAVTGGLSAGQFYHTAGTVKVVI